jgi:hypothetical protein
MKGDLMMDLDLLYVKYRQQELSQEAAAQALAAKVRPAAGRRWWGRLLDTLTTLFSGGRWQALRRSHVCLAPAAVRVSQPRHERKHIW